MIREHVEKYYLGEGFNCAEALLHAADDALLLQLPQEAFKLMSGYGGGMACGETCGAICSALAVVSYLFVDGCAHNTPGFRAKCADCMRSLREAFGSTQCVDIHPKFKSRETRCLPTIERAADVLEEVLKKYGAI